MLKCDVKNYFASINHEILYQLILRKIKDTKVLWLIKRIIDSTPSPGVPIGNLTSQIFANLYLNELIEKAKVINSLQSWLGYALHADSYKLRLQIIKEMKGVIL